MTLLFPKFLTWNMHVITLSQYVLDASMSHICELVLLLFGIIFLSYAELSHVLIPDQKRGKLWLVWNNTLSHYFLFK